MVKCIICKKEFNKSKKFIEFFEFYRGNKIFVICREDIKIIINQIKEMAIEPESYKEHIKWNLRERKLLEIAKNIYKNCKNKHEKVDFKRAGSRVYDLMCEECWNTFRKEEEKFR